MSLILLTNVVQRVELNGRSMKQFEVKGGGVSIELTAGGLFFWHACGWPHMSNLFPGFYDIINEFYLRGIYEN